MRNSNPLESAIERKFVSYVNKDGGVCKKGNSKGYRGWPDREVFLPGGGYFFMELKRKGCEPTPLQKEIHKRLRAGGHKVYVADTYEKAIEIYEHEKKIWKEFWKHF